MTPYYDRAGITVFQGDCLDALRELADNSVDSVITDPPYEISFMSKKWDGDGIAFSPEVWCECLRVAKPGATLMAFGGTRTYHRLACAIEDAGWEIRDCISYFHDGTQQQRAFLESLNEEQLGAYLELHYAGQGASWVYGSGFPKSANISKMLDVQAIVGCPQCDGVGCEKCGGTGKVRGAEREVVGIRSTNINRPITDKWEKSREQLNGSPFLPSGGNVVKITAPATSLAKLWDGWGTGLKPAVEPIVVAQKKLDGTYANNAKVWGVSGLWIDGGRVECNLRPKLVLDAKETNNSTYTGRLNGSLSGGSKAVGVTTKGRWPANCIHDNSDEVLAEFDKAGVRTSGERTPTGNPKYGGSSFNESATLDNSFSRKSQGSAARFFAKCPPDSDPTRFRYCPKAGKRERGKGNNHPTVKPLSLLKYLCRITKTPTGGIVLDPFAGSGTTGLAARAEGRQCILIEKEPEYCEIIVNRLEGEEDVSPTQNKPKQESKPEPEQMKLF